MVPETGLEPAHHKAYAPKAYVYTNFTTRAYHYYTIEDPKRRGEAPEIYKLGVVMHCVLRESSKDHKWLLRQAKCQVAKHPPVQSLEYLS